MTNLTILDAMLGKRFPMLLKVCAVTPKDEWGEEVEMRLSLIQAEYRHIMRKELRS